MQRIIEKMKREIREIIKKRYAESALWKINDDVKEIYARYKRTYPSLRIETEAADAQRKQTEKEIRKEWTSKRLAAAPAEVNAILGRDFARVKGEIDTKVNTAIRRGISTDMPMRKMVSLVDRAFDRGIEKARTVARTARLAQNRAEYLRTAIESGATKFKYVGPASDRDFCARQLGRVFTLDEIAQLDNGQHLPVIAYMGGYNCRHRWQAVYD